MTELKTLKDMRTDEDDVDNAFFESELRAEAIKWIKFYNKNHEFSRCYALMDFFNITEEDLK